MDEVSVVLFSSKEGRNPAEQIFAQERPLIGVLG
jgi:hypothetical protein